jgi:hypothetical protein
MTPATLVNLIGQEQGEKTVKIGEKISAFGFPRARAGFRGGAARPVGPAIG